MLKQFRLFSLIICTLVASSTTAQAPFSRGVNITGWFQASGPRQIQFSQYSKKDFENIIGYKTLIAVNNIKNKQ